CDGGSLHDCVERRGAPLPVGEALPLIFQALDGLEYTHNVFGPGAGLVHRDLKPQNVFLSGPDAGRGVRVGDFGLAKAFDRAGLGGRTGSGGGRGTRSFRPRRQVVNLKSARPPVDVWAAAATLYSLLTGRAPRDFPAGVDWWVVVLQRDAVPVRDRNPAVPRRLAEVIDRALIDRPAIPFAAVDEFRRALKAAL